MKLIIEIKNMNDMIKKYVLIISALVMIGWGCQKDLDLYSGRDFVYFNPSAGLDSTYFSFAYVDVNKPVDSLYIQVRTGGEVKNYDRQVKVKIAETNATADTDFRTFPDSYTISAGNTFGTILVELLRPEVLKREERYIILELEENEYFTLNYPTKVSSSDEEYSAIRYKIVFSEIMTPPIKWSTYEFGEFSVKKLDVICEEMNLTREMFNDASYMINSRQKYIAAKMVQILNDYSANGHPIYEDDNVTLMRMGDVYYN